MPKLITGLLAAIALFACGQESSPTAGTSTAQDVLGIYSNPDMADASASNPTGSPSNQGVRIASFAVQLPEGAYIRAVGIYSRLYNPKAGTEYTLGHVFQNLRLRNAATGEQIGDAILTLGISDDSSENRNDARYGLDSDVLRLGEPVYGFLAAPYYGLPQPARRKTADVYADILPDPSPGAVALINDHAATGVITPVVSVYLTSGETQIVWVKEPMQRLYIAH